MALSTVIRKFGKSFLVLAVLCFLIALSYHVEKTYLRLKQIEVVGSDVRVAIDEQKLPTHMLFFPTEALATEIAKDNPLIANVKISKLYPDTVKIVIEKRTPVVTLVTASQRLLLSREYVVVSADTATATYPVIFAPAMRPVRIGETLTDQAIASAVTLLTHPQETFTVESVTIDPGGFLRARIQHMDILFLQTNDLALIADTLQTLIAGFRIKGLLPKVIDLRFDKPIVTF